jgi:hypothetical protein
MVYADKVIGKKVIRTISWEWGKENLMENQVLEISYDFNKTSFLSYEDSGWLLLRQGLTMLQYFNRIDSLVLEFLSPVLWATSQLHLIHEL